jgi:hypothetical protein
MEGQPISNKIQTQLRRNIIPPEEIKVLSERPMAASLSAQ